MRERGTVTRVGPTSVDVALVASDACERCGACSGDHDRRMLPGVRDDLGASVGDLVEVDTPARARRRAQGLVFLLPPAVVVLGYLAGFLLFAGSSVNPDAAGAVIGIGAGAAMLLALRFVGRGAQDGTGTEPRVRAIIARGNTRRTAR